MDKVKILLFASNPSGTSQLMLDEEVREITVKIQRSEYRDSLDLISRWATRTDDLLQELNIHKPAIVHFSGHGSETGEIYLTDDNHNLKPVNTIALKSLFHLFNKNIQVVVLNACYSELQAVAIAEEIDTVIGMQTEVSDEAAIIFAASFYRAIGFGCSVQEAFDQGKTSLLLENIPEDTTPQLLIRKGVDASKIILINPQESKDPGKRTHGKQQRDPRSNLVVNVNIKDYLGNRVRPISDFQNRPRLPKELEGINTEEHISDLRHKLLKFGLDKPKEITVKGVLYPAALLTSGWWEKVQSQKIDPSFQWKDGVQAWLFNGFDLWAPSWDFTWDIKAWSAATTTQFCIAQIGGGDEADSLPVFVPLSRIPKMNELFLDNGGLIEVELKAFLASRKHFCTRKCPGEHSKCQMCKKLMMFGGLLDFCLWIDENNRDHGIKQCRKAEFYSGYLWKCVAPKLWVPKNDMLTLDKLIFIWEHTNFANSEALKYNLEFLSKKEEYFKSKYGDLILVQKSSSFVPGNPEWDSRQVFDLLTGGKPTIA